MKTITLFRPVGLKEMELIAQSGYRNFPPRLSWQPIFYPVMNQLYAEQIAREWNTHDEASGYCGIVTIFEVEAAYISNFEIQNVGGNLHNELWIPAEKLFEFNAHIVGEIIIANAYFGEKYNDTSDPVLFTTLQKFKL